MDLLRHSQYWARGDSKYRWPILSTQANDAQMFTQKTGRIEAYRYRKIVNWPSKSRVDWKNSRFSSQIGFSGREALDSHTFFTLDPGLSLDRSRVTWPTRPTKYGLFWILIKLGGEKI